MKVDQRHMGRGVQAESQARFLDLWFRALKRWGTSKEDIEGARVVRSSFVVDGGKYEAAWTEGGIRDRRYDLMVAERNELAGLGHSCIFCAKLASRELRMGGALALTPCGVLVPNRYPGALGHSLYIPWGHTQLSVSETDWKATVPSVYMLIELIELCDKFQLQASRNHPRDGMSIPEHDHIHLYPASLRLFPAIDAVERDEVGDGMLSKRYTPFQTYKVSAKSPSTLAKVVASILAECNRHNRVATFVYSKQAFYVTTRVPGEMPRLQIGGGISGHRMNIYDSEIMSQIRDWIPRSA